MSKSVIEVLTEARAKVAAGWCQQMPAQNAIGDCEDTKSAAACKWCAFGSLLAVTDQYGEALDLLNKLTSEQRGVINWNDEYGRTQAEVLDLFDRAIAKASEPKSEEASNG